MEIKVLGPGCPNCQKVEGLVQAAAKELGIDAKIEKVTDMLQIIKYTMSTPGIVVNGTLKYSGKPLPTLEKVKDILKGGIAP